MSICLGEGEAVQSTFERTQITSRFVVVNTTFEVFYKCIVLPSCDPYAI